MAVFRLVTPILSANSIVRAGESWTSCPCLSSVVLIKRDKYQRCENGSFGYFAASGEIKSGSEVGHCYGPTFGGGDIVGAGLHVDTKDIFFTKNGVNLGCAFQDINVLNPLYPTFSLHCSEEKVVPNFGAAPFTFDIKSYIAGCLKRDAVEVFLRKLQPAITHELVREFLICYGYSDTISMLDEEWKTVDVSASRCLIGLIPEEGLKIEGLDLANRSGIRAAVVSDVLDTYKCLLRQIVPEVQQRNPLDFITKRNFSDFLWTTTRMQTVEDMAQASPCLQRHGDVNRLGSFLIDAFALMGYDTPEKCELNPLTFRSRVDLIADMAIYEVFELMHPCSDKLSPFLDRVPEERHSSALRSKLSTDHEGAATRVTKMTKMLTAYTRRSTRAYGYASKAERLLRHASALGVVFFSM